METWQSTDIELARQSHHFAQNVGECPAYLNTRLSHFGNHKIELSDLVKKDKIFKLASFVQKTKRLEKY